MIYLNRNPYLPSDCRQSDIDDTAQEEAEPVDCSVMGELCREFGVENLEDMFAAMEVLYRRPSSLADCKAFFCKWLHLWEEFIRENRGRISPAAIAKMEEMERNKAKGASR